MIIGAATGGVVHSRIINEAEMVYATQSGKYEKKNRFALVTVQFSEFAGLGIMKVERHRIAILFQQKPSLVV